MSRWIAAWLDLLLLPITLMIGLWVRRQQARILRSGTALSVAQQQLARALGVREAQRVRIVAVPRIGLPLPRWMGALAQRAGLLSPHIAGMTLGYGIALREDCCDERNGFASLLAHELTHVAQYERLGGIHGFLRAYVRECVSPGYPNGPLECEAHEAARRSFAREGDVLPYGPVYTGQSAR